MIEITSLKKTYGAAGKSVQALNNIDLQISPGMFGLLGPNGVGKSKRNSSVWSGILMNFYNPRLPMHCLLAGVLLSDGTRVP